jgi:hypothetical protein
MNRTVNESEWGVLNSPRKRAACVACFAALIGLVVVGVASWSGDSTSHTPVARKTTGSGYGIKSEGKWLALSGTNPLDDTRTVGCILRADSGTSAFGEAVTLVLRCQSGVTEAYINWGSYLADETTVTWRIGSAPSVTSEWSESSDNTRTFFPSWTSQPTASSPIKFIRTLMATDQFVARILPYMEDPITAVFDVRGLAAAVQRLKVPCGW